MSQNNELRRLAIQIAAQLPTDPDDAIEVLNLATKLVRDFLAPKETAAEVVPLRIVERESASA